MKNKVFLSILLTVVVFELGFSQVRFGLRGSAGITNITNVHQESKSRTGFQIGVSALIPILNNDILYFEPEINYSAQGEFYVPSKIYPGADKQKIFMDYINIDRKSTRLNSSHVAISYAVCCLKKITI